MRHYRHYAINSPGQTNRRLWFTRVIRTTGRNTIASGHRRASSRPLRLSGSALPAIGAVVLGAAMLGPVVTQEGSGAAQADLMRSSLAAAQLSVTDLPNDVTRAGGRPAPAAKDQIFAKMAVTRDTAIRERSSPSAKQVDTAAQGDTVKVTPVSTGAWSQIVHRGQLRWVKTAHLAKTGASKYAADLQAVKRSVTKTKDSDSDSDSDKTPDGTSMKECGSGSGVESGLMPDTIRVHRSVCAKFPNVSDYGGVGGGGEHAAGRALDIMTSGAEGDQIAQYVRAHASELGVSQVIWQQRIWTVQRSSEGWRPMSDRGSPTANHMDHVHVTTYGDSGSAG